jgi:hypothetical protein
LRFIHHSCQLSIGRRVGWDEAQKEYVNEWNLILLAVIEHPRIRSLVFPDSYLFDVDRFRLITSFACANRSISLSLGDSMEEEHYLVFADAIHNRNSFLESLSLDIPRKSHFPTVGLDLIKSNLKELTITLQNSKCLDFQGCLQLLASTCSIEKLSIRVASWNRNDYGGEPITSDCIQWICNFLEKTTISKITLCWHIDKGVTNTSFESLCFIIETMENISYLDLSLDVHGRERLGGYDHDLKRAFELNKGLETLIIHLFTQDQKRQINEQRDNTKAKRMLLLQLITNHHFQMFDKNLLRRIYTY